MKIISRVGEKLLPASLRAELGPVLVFTGAGAALCAGTCRLVTWGWARLRERLDLRESLAAIAAGIGAAGYSAWHAPRIAVFAIPAALLAWCVAAWTVAPPADVEPEAPVEAEEQPAANAPEDVYAATLEWIRRLIGDNQGVHLRDLLDHAQAHGMFTGLDVAALRAHLERWDIPVRDSVRVRGLGVTVGIRKDDLPPLPEASPESGGQDPPETQLHAV